jgi:hypothetical protein
VAELSAALADALISLHRAEIVLAEFHDGPDPQADNLRLRNLLSASDLARARHEEIAADGGIDPTERLDGAGARSHAGETGRHNLR